MEDKIIRLDKSMFLTFPNSLLTTRTNINLVSLVIQDY